MKAGAGRWFSSLLGGAAAGLAAAFAFAVVLSIVDLYLSGHGRPPLSRSWIELPRWGVSLSRADVVLLTGALMVAVVVGSRLASRRRRAENAGDSA